MTTRPLLRSSLRRGAAAATTAFVALTCGACGLDDVGSGSQAGAVCWEGSAIGGDGSASPSADASSAQQERWWAENHKPLGDAAALIEREQPDDFAFGFFDPASPDRLIIAFAGRAPQIAVAALAATGSKFDVREDCGFTFREYVAQAEVVAQALFDLPPELRPIMVGPAPDVGAGVIRVTLDRSLRQQSAWYADIVRVAHPFTVRYDWGDEIFTVGAASTAPLLG